MNENDPFSAFEQERTIDDGPADLEGNGDVKGDGLTEPMTAEVHILVRSHGPELEDFDTQTGSLNGGCPPNTCANLYVSPHLAPN